MSAARDRGIKKVRKALYSHELCHETPMKDMLKKVHDHLRDNEDKLGLTPGAELKCFDDLLSAMLPEGQAGTPTGGPEPAVLPRLTYPEGGYEPRKIPRRKAFECHNERCRVEDGGMYEQLAAGYENDTRGTINTTPTMNYGVEWKCNQCGKRTRDPD